MIVLDSSAVLAILLDEPGQAEVLAEIGDSIISTVNVAEIYTKLTQIGLGLRAADTILSNSSLQVVPLSWAQASFAGKIFSSTRRAGLSLGDRCCLALAVEREIPALTGDRSWSEIANDVGVEVRLIR